MGSIGPNFASCFSTQIGCGIRDAKWKSLATRSNESFTKSLTWSATYFVFITLIANGTPYSLQSRASGNAVFECAFPAEKAVHLFQAGKTDNCLTVPRSKFFSDRAVEMPTRNLHVGSQIELCSVTNYFQEVFPHQGFPSPTCTCNEHVVSAEICCFVDEQFSFFSA